MEYIKETISFNSEGQTLRGTLVRPTQEGIYPVVIFFHGLSSSEAGHIMYAEHLAERGIVGITFNLRGHGNSDGEFSALNLHDGIKDGFAVYEYALVLPFVDKTKIGLCGSSVGSAIATVVAKEKFVESLVLRVSATYTEEMMNMSYSEIMDKELNIFKAPMDIAKTPFVTAIASYTGSLLVVISGLDEIIPIEIPEFYFNNAVKAKEKQKVIMPSATHSLSQTPSLKNYFSELLGTWFKKTLI